MKRLFYVILAAVIAASCTNLDPVSGRDAGGGMEDDGFSVLAAASALGDNSGTDIVFRLVGGFPERGYGLSYEIDGDPSLSLYMDGVESRTPVAMSFGRDSACVLRFPVFTPGAGHRIAWTVVAESGRAVSGELSFTDAKPSVKNERLAVSFGESGDSARVFMDVRLPGTLAGGTYDMHYSVDNSAVLTLSDSRGGLFVSGSSVALSSGSPVRFFLPEVSAGAHSVRIMLVGSGESCSDASYGFSYVEPVRPVVPEVENIIFRNASGERITNLDLWGGNDYDVLVFYEDKNGETLLSDYGSWDRFTVEYFVKGVKVDPGRNFSGKDIVSLSLAGLYGGKGTENHRLHAADWYPMGLLSGTQVKSSEKSWASGGLTYRLTVYRKGASGTLTGNVQGTLGYDCSMPVKKDANGYHHYYVCQRADRPYDVTLYYPSTTPGRVEGLKMGVNRVVSGGTGIDVDFMKAGVVGGGLSSFSGTFPVNLSEGAHYRVSGYSSTFTYVDPKGISHTYTSLGKNSYVLSIVDPFVLDGRDLKMRDVEVLVALYSPVTHAVVREGLDHYDNYKDDSWVEYRDLNISVGALPIDSDSYEPDACISYFVPKGEHVSGDSVIGVDSFYSFLNFVVKDHTHGDLGFDGVILRLSGDSVR